MTNSKRLTCALLIATLLIVLLNVSPNILGYLVPPKNCWYPGHISYFDPWDINFYLSAMGWGARDGWGFQNTHTISPHQSLPIFTLYTALGKMANILDLPNHVIFNLSLVALGPVFLLTLYEFVSLFFDNDKDSFFCFLLVTLGGGLGWIFPHSLYDVRFTDFLTLSTLSRPHYTLSGIGFLGTLSFLLTSTEKRSPTTIMFFLLSLFLLATIHPYLLAVSLMAAVTYYIYYGDKDNQLGVAAIIITLILYAVFILSKSYNNPGFTGIREQQNPYLNPIYLVLSYGLLAPFALFELSRKSQGKENTFLKIWLAVQLPLVYIPLGFRTQFLKYLFIPVAILAFKGLISFCQKYKTSFNFLFGIVLLISSLSGIYILRQRINAIGNCAEKWVYLTHQEKETLDFLRKEGQPEDGVISWFRLSNFIPANTNKRIFVSQGHLTDNWSLKIQQVAIFYQGGASEEEVKEFLQKNAIKFIVWGPDEKMIAKREAFPYLSFPYLKPAFQNDEIAIFRRVD